jgi:tryptophan-rich sensory protein
MLFSVLVASLCLIAFVWGIYIWPYDFSFYNAVDLNKKSGKAKWPKPWFFTVMWSILYPTITTAEIIHMHQYGESTGFSVPLRDDFYAILILYVVNLMLNHFWLILFTRFKKMWVALLELILLFGVSVTILTLYGVYSYWASFGLFIPYVIFLVVAMALNINWVTQSVKSS